MTGTDPHIIVFGNTVRGAGKTVTAAQATVALLRLGYRVGTLDLDEDNEALSLFLHRRRDLDPDLPQPLHRRLPAIGRDEKTLQNALALALAELSTGCDFILVDTPHGEQPLARLAHGYADTVVTPLKEEQLPALGSIKSGSARIETPAPYAEMLEEQAVRRVDRGMVPAQWLVLRSRLLKKPISQKKYQADIFDKISGELGFAPLTGLTERSMYSDLFSQGKTVQDLTGDFDLPAIAARQEVRNIICAIIPKTFQHVAAQS